MPTVHVTVHPRGLHPMEAVRAWHLHVEEGMGIRDVCCEVVNMLGQKPSYKAVWRAIQGVKTYEAPPTGQHLSRLAKLVRGMPKRLRSAKAKQYGRCGK